MYRTIGKACGAAAGITVLSYTAYAAGSSSGGGAVSLYEHITVVLGAALLACIAATAGMLFSASRDTARRTTIAVEARVRAIVPELVVEALLSDEIQEMLEALTRRVQMQAVQADQLKKADTRATIRGPWPASARQREEA